MSNSNNKLKIAIITSNFNVEITKELQLGAIEYLIENQVLSANIQTFEVPGAVELPVIAQAVAQQQKYNAIIVLGAIIRGETDHYQWVCHQVSYGCQRVALDNNVPVIFGVLTTDNEEQAIQRIGGTHGHKGKEAAATAIAMTNLMQNIVVNKTQFRGFL